MVCRCSFALTSEQLATRTLTHSSSCRSDACAWERLPSLRSRAWTVRPRRFHAPDLPWALSRFRLALVLADSGRVPRRAPSGCRLQHDWAADPASAPHRRLTCQPPHGDWRANRFAATGLATASRRLPHRRRPRPVQRLSFRRMESPSLGSHSLPIGSRPPEPTMSPALARMDRLSR